MRRQFLLGLGASLCCAASASAKAAPVQLADIAIEALAISVLREDATFAVIDSRMDETGTAGVFFGLVGATVNSAINASEDASKAEPLQAAAAAISLDAIVAQSIAARLRARGTIATADTPQAASHTLLVDIGDWGLIRRGQKPDMLMRTFLKMNIRIADSRNRPVWGPQREHSVGQRAALLQDFTPEVFRADMEALAALAGQQVANKLIYR